MTPEEAKTYRQDTGLVIIFVIFVWMALGFVLNSISGLAANGLIRMTTLVVGILAGLFVTSALIAVLVHLKKNQVAIYNEEFSHILRQVVNMPWRNIFWVR